MTSSYSRIPFQSEILPCLLGNLNPPSPHEYQSRRSESKHMNTINTLELHVGFSYAWRGTHGKTFVLHVHSILAEVTCFIFLDAGIPEVGLIVGCLVVNLDEWCLEGK